MTQTILVTGANRGIGLEFARQYAAQGARVLAAARRPDRADALNALAAAHDHVTLHELDVAQGASVAAFCETLKDTPIDLLINNAGVSGGLRQGLGAMDYDAWAEALAVNTIAPFRIADALIENIAASEGKTIVTITSGLGSIAEAGGGMVAYRTSKAAVNMAMKALSVDVKERGIAVLMIHPGWVRTDMGGEKASLSAAESVAQMRAVIDGFGTGRTGAFLSFNGEEIPF